MRFHVLRAVVVCAVLLSSAIAVGMPAEAAVLDVTRLDDPTPNGCEIHDCSLREAVIAANATPAADTIRVPGGRLERSIGGFGENDSAVGDLDITSPVKIVGEGAGVTIIDANALDSVIHVLGGGRLELVDVTLTGGNALFAGGGINNEGETIVRRCEITLSESSNNADGGGINNKFGSLVVESSKITGNTSVRAGGGLHSSAPVSIVASVISGNTSTTDGGGAAFDGAESTIESTLISGNNASGSGGGVSATAVSDVTVLYSKLLSNEAAAGGGSIYLKDTANVGIDRTTIGDSQAIGGGGIEIASGTFFLGTSTVTGNRASFGGGIANSGGDATILDSTISGNVVSGDGGGIDAFNTNTTTITESTIAFNRADSDGDDVGNGGGIQVVSGTMTVGASIISNNGDGPGTSRPDVSGIFTSPGSNVVTVKSGSTGFTQASDLEADPLLGPLVPNGGPTRTHAITPTSPALDLVASASELCQSADQRSVPRPQGAGCDSGSYEFTACRGVQVTIVGTNLRDVINGTDADDSILALGGSDVVDGGGGDDAICGGAGNDTLRGGDGNDFLSGSGGTDRCIGGPGQDRMSACERKVQ